MWYDKDQSDDLDKVQHGFVSYSRTVQAIIAGLQIHSFEQIYESMHARIVCVYNM